MWFQQYNGPHFSFPETSQKDEHTLQSANSMMNIDNPNSQNATLGALNNITQLTENVTSVPETTLTSSFDENENTILTSMTDSDIQTVTTSTEFLEQKSTLAHSRILCKLEENNTPQIASYQALYILCGVMMGVFVLSCVVLLVIYVKRKRNTFSTRHRQYTLNNINDAEDMLKY